MDGSERKTVNQMLYVVLRETTRRLWRSVSLADTIGVSCLCIFDSLIYLSLYKRRTYSVFGIFEFTQINRHLTLMRTAG